MRKKQLTMTFTYRCLSKSLDIIAVYNHSIQQLTLLKEGVIIDRQEMQGYTSEQLKKYLDGIEEGLKDQN